ncbi:Tn3 family transposase [Streptomyces sp. NBC_01362]|uniref:Tn3 family transposase n=1 Tax=Streptomyces sp. NBC_01362 TaxID=2903839 RepID=UPI002E3425AE|nr:Tn3 family transposase [Streptomyces sp. NBC_01362]
MYPLCSIDYAPPASRRARFGSSPRAYRRWSCAGPARSSSLNRFSQWVGFGNRGVIADNDPVEQEKEMKFNALLTNAVIFHNALNIAEIVRQLLEEGWEIAPEDLAHVSPYLTEHLQRFGEYSTHELGIQPTAYDPKLNVDFTQLRDQDPAAAGFSQAAGRLGAGRHHDGHGRCARRPHSGRYQRSTRR